MVTQLDPRLFDAGMTHEGDRASGLLAGPFTVHSERGNRGSALRFDLDDVSLGSVCAHIIQFLRGHELLDYPLRLSIEYTLELQDHERLRRLNRWFDGHRQTSLQGPTSIMNKRIVDYAALLSLFEAFVTQREALAEVYDFQAQDQLRNHFKPVSQIRLIFTAPGIRYCFRAAGLGGGKQAFLDRCLRQPVGGVYGDCVLEAVLTVAPDMPARLGAPATMDKHALKIEWLRRKAKLQDKRGQGLEIEDLEQIERHLKYLTAARKGSQRECGIGFYIWDRHHHPRRIPVPSHTAKYKDPQNNYRYAIHLVVKDDHVHVWRDVNTISNNELRAKSYFSAAVKAL